MGKYFLSSYHRSEWGVWGGSHLLPSCEANILRPEVWLPPQLLLVLLADKRTEKTKIKTQHSAVQETMSCMEKCHNGKDILLLFFVFSPGSFSLIPTAWGRCFLKTILCISQIQTYLFICLERINQLFNLYVIWIKNHSTSY